MEDGVRSRDGDWLLEPDADPGEPRYSVGETGRGTSGTTAIIEWIGATAGGGIVGNVAYGGPKAAARRAAAVLKCIRDETETHIGTTRGMAALVAVDVVVERHGEAERLDVEAVEQPSTMGGEVPPETNHLAVEPWVALLVNESRTVRYVVVVAPDGSIRGTLATPMGEFEALWSSIRSKAV